ncbi:MAG: HEAT repeat domain-containing protein [Elusimicrobiota bacterium]
MTRAIIAGVILVLSLPAGAAASPFSTATFQGFDVYRSTIVTEAFLSSRYGSLIRDYVALRSGYARRARTMKARIESELKAYAGLAYAELYYGDYWTAADRVAYITFDLVDAVDAGVRIPFKAVPAGSVADPDGLLAAWGRYQELGKSLQLSAQLGLERPSCPAFYCSYGSATPELAAYERAFLARVPVVKKALLQVLSDDADPERRANAMYLLSYLTDGAEVVELAFKALSDPDAGVRTAALQVLADVTTYHKDLPIEPSRLYPVLDYPSTTDRSRALGVLIGLADNPKYQETLRRNPPPRILDLLKMRQPVIHDSAFAFLVLLSREGFGRLDHAGWEQWLANPPKKRK